jgi:hypothetical protein
MEVTHPMLSRTKKLAAAIVAAASLSANAAFADQFSGLDLTLGIEAGGKETMFDYLPAPTEDTYQSSEYSPDRAFAFFGLAEALASLQFHDTYVGLSGFAYRGLDSSADYELISTRSNGQSHSTTGSYDLEDFAWGGAFEAGFSRSAQRWVYVDTGEYARTTYSKAVFHFGVGLGAAYRKASSSLDALGYDGIAYYGLFRVQAMILGPLGIQGSVRFLTESLSFDSEWTSVSGSVGAFVKL